MASVLLVVDAMAVVYRAFYAIRSMQTGAGHPTNAVFGFMRMLQQMRDWWHPTHLTVVFDGGLPQARMQLLPAYKQQRKPMPDELRAQLPDIEEFLDLSGVTRIRMEGQEADDVMAAIACQAAPDAGSVLLATGDKDLYQVVNAKVRLVSMSGEQSAMGPQEVLRKTGVPPERVVEWLSLVGDHADNIPGVAGVGPKTAARLLQDYGSWQALWEHKAEIKSDRLRLTLAESWDLVARNIALVRLRTDIENVGNWESWRGKAPRLQELLNFCERLELKSFADRLRQPELFG